MLSKGLQVEAIFLNKMKHILCECRAYVWGRRLSKSNAMECTSIDKVLVGIIIIAVR